jgi:hypothetical protein
MNLQGKCAARDLSSAMRGKSRRSSKAPAQADKSCCSRIGLETAREKRSTFAEDFLVEHSHAVLCIDLFAAAGDYEAAPRETQKSAQSYGFPS